MSTARRSECARLGAAAGGGAPQFPADAIYIFGHGIARFGVTGTRDDLLIMRDLLTALLEHVQQGIAAGRTKELIVALDNLPGFPDFHVPAPNRLPGILGTVYDELVS